MSRQANARGYFWRFKIRETYTVSQTSLTSLVGTRDCPPKGCQTPLSVPFKPRSDSDFGCHCPFLSQTKDYCKRGSPWTQDYGGRPYWSYWILGSKGPDNEFHLCRGQNGSIMAHIPNLWDNRWIRGEMIALYAGCTASKPSAHIMISRELTLPVPTQREVTTEVLQSEQSPQKALQQSSTPTWLQLFQASLQLMNLTTSINVADCFLCASLQHPLLAAVPINASSSIKASPALQNSSCTPPLSSVPLWAPDSTLGPLPTHTCHNPPSTSRSKLSLSCHINLMVTELVSPLGLYFWCHNTLHSWALHTGNYSSPTYSLWRS
jgi:hypothetical protein